jgi:hypothetical protein
MKLHWLLYCIAATTVSAQDYRWQQRVEYTMNVRLDVTTHRLAGDQKLVYFNNSPDTLRKVYYHLYFNAFQPGSMMDVRSRTISDPDPRVGSRIAALKPDEIGYQKINSLLQNGRPVQTKITGTVMEVTLAQPLLPKTKATFDMKFEAQVPVQVRRSGRNNREGIAYSMTQWYPKMAEYDYQGWHNYQYVAREFHQVWGDFDVKITLDPTFVVAATGKLQNPNQIGYGYESKGATVTRTPGNLTWHFKAKDVIDFAWAADPDYQHEQIKTRDGVTLHFFYQKNEKTEPVWKQLPELGAKAFQFLSDTFGKYPFDTYSVIQGGDGGMEYPMCTLILGEGKLDGVAGTMIHEMAHSWYQMTLANNESLYAWMDEGFTVYASNEAEAYAFGTENPHAGLNRGYLTRVSQNLYELPSQHSDHFTTNTGYTMGSYGVGALVLNQMKYLVGTENFYKGMRYYYNTWKMRHPEPVDFIRCMEKVSGLQLGWFLRYFVYTTKKIDYAVSELRHTSDSTFITLTRLGELPMPIDFVIKYENGKEENFYIPLNELMGEKPAEKGLQREVLPIWNWVAPTYEVKLKKRPQAVERVEIDPLEFLPDVNRKNNRSLTEQITIEGNR